MNLRTKYSLSILSLMLCLVASFGGIVFIHSQSTIKALDARSSEAIEQAMFTELQEKQELSVKVLAAALKNPVYQYDMQRIEEAIRAMKQQPDVLQVYVYDRSGRIIHDGTKQLQLYDRILEDEITQNTIETRNPTIKLEEYRLHIAMPITIEDELLGGVMVEFSLGGILAHIAQTKADLREQYQALTRNDFLVIANKGKDEFLGFMSHELRTPLNVVIGYAGILRDGILGEINSKQEETLQKMITLSKELLRMVKQILDATKIEAGAVKICREPVDLPNLFGDLKSSYNFSLGKPVHLNWVRSFDLPRPITDREKLKHVFQNLIDNAIKFTDQGQVMVSARPLPEGGAIEFRVVDTGVGIRKESISSIFQMFDQADSSETRAHGGVGLGLYIVKKLTDLLGAKIEVESEPGKGSTFTVTLPCSSDSGRGGSLPPLDDEMHQQKSPTGFHSGRAQSRCDGKLEV